MACILLRSSAVRVHDSQAYRKMDVTRKHIGCILELKEIPLSSQTGFNLVNAVVVFCVIIHYSFITDEGSKPEMLSRIAKATAALTKLKSVWNDRSISLTSKIRLMRPLVTSIFLYSCESWTLTAELQRK